MGHWLSLQTFTINPIICTLYLETGSPNKHLSLTSDFCLADEGFKMEGTEATSNVYPLYPEHGCGLLGVK